MTGKAGDFSSVAKAKIGLLRCQGIKGRLDLSSGLHQLRLLVGTGSVVRIAEHDHRTRFDLPHTRVERLKLAHHSPITHREKRGLQCFTGHAFGYHIEAWLLRFQTVEH